MGKNWGILCPYFSCFYVYKGFFSGFSLLLSEKVKRGREWLFFRKLSGDFFVGFCRNRPKRENIFWESGFSFVFFLYFLSQSYFFSQPFIIFFWEFALKNTWKDDSRLRCFSRRTSSFFAGFFWDRKDFWPFPSVF